ncbi:DUF2637 domain-containing protein [Streptomyces albipurpureus]|uniref:DUF2637 domain-containing protein n=1 Tax=Streptomyces albipurpureus TaxID=2897419 RepID=A0ABT0V385_9ACTN|nr:DUF2637 domain-containing protein [Streptomyces sp. CWNU-1]MCM2394013.1 DUF2637 domain-containing protein [Streptomyces sp. CWNU-1]
MAAMQLTRTHRILIGVVVAGAVIIAAIGFAGSYAAVRDLAERKGFGDFALVFPIGIDAGICVLLALDLLLTWMRIPFPLLRQTAWLLTVATIAFNGAASWPDPLGVGMHSVIPILFVVTVEAARHAVGRIADITADKHMEGVRITRWLLSPIPTFKLWRRMKLWELRSYEQVIKLEQDRLIYQARLQARFGRAWRRKAPVESLMPLRLAKYGVPLAETAAAGLAAAGIDPVLLPPAPKPQQKLAAPPHAAGQPELPRAQDPAAEQHPSEHPDHQQPYTGPGAHGSPWFTATQMPQDASERAFNPTYVEGLEPTPVRVPSGPGRTRPLGGIPGQRPEAPAPHLAQAHTHAQGQPYPQAHAHPQGPAQPQAQSQGQLQAQFQDGTQSPSLGEAHPQEQAQPHPAQMQPHAQARPPQGPLPQTEAPQQAQQPAHQAVPQEEHLQQVQEPRLQQVPQEEPAQQSAQQPVFHQGEPVHGPGVDLPDPEQLAEDQEFYEAAYPVFASLSHDLGKYPSVEHLDIHLSDVHGMSHPRGTALLRQAMPEFRQRMEAELEAEHIA